jgi:hypothetical protein
MNGVPDFLPDRVDLVGSDEDCSELRVHLNALPPWKKLLSGLDRSDDVQDVIDDGAVVVKVRRTGGYFYVVAWLAPTGVAA